MSGDDVQTMSEQDLRRTLAEYSSELTAYDEAEEMVTTQALGTLIAAPATSAAGVNPSVMTVLTDILNEMKLMRQEQKTERDRVKKAMEAQDTKMTKLTAVLAQQQRFCEGIDARFRETNVVIMGLPDTGKAFGGKTDDDEKVKLIFTAIGLGDIESEIMRLGAADPAKCRPLLVKTASKQMRDSLLEEAKKLKDKEDGVPLAQKVGYDSVYVKKDIHPSVRREWKRLRDLVDTEKVKPVNQGCDIKLDPKTRTVTRNGVVIDRWHLLNF